MQKVFIRLALYLVGLGLALFIGVFIWANWTPLSPGEKADPVNFVLFDIQKIKTNQKRTELINYIKDLDGVQDVIFSAPLKSIVVTYKVLETSDANIILGSKEDMHFNLKHKMIADNGQPKCPMTSSLTFFGKVRRKLNCRG